MGQGVHSYPEQVSILVSSLSAFFLANITPGGIARDPKRHRDSLDRETGVPLCVYLVYYMPAINGWSP